MVVCHNDVTREDINNFWCLIKEIYSTQSFLCHHFPKHVQQYINEKSSEVEWSGDTGDFKVIECNAVLLYSYTELQEKRCSVS